MRKFAYCLALAVVMCAGAGVLAQVGQPRQLTAGVFFREGDLKKGHCNNGWVAFNDYVLVIDANFPEAAGEVLAQAKGSAGARPLRFVFNTTSSEDHAFGNDVWGAQGATIVASEDCLKTLTTQGPAMFAALGNTRADVKAGKLRLPQMSFDRRLVLDDGSVRVELISLGHCHKPGDAVAYLPRARVLFTGDVCVNGPYNNLAQANTEQWLKALDTLLKLEINVVAPGHGPAGDKSILQGQRDFLDRLRRQVQAGVAAKKTLEQIRNQVSIVDSRLTNWVGPGLAMQVDAAYRELTRQDARSGSKAAASAAKAPIAQQALNRVQPRAATPEKNTRGGDVKPKADAARIKQTGERRPVAPASKRKGT